MKFKTWILCLSGLLLLAANCRASEQVTNLADAIKIISALKYQHGQINLSGGVATLNLPTNICYLSPDDAETVLVKLWGNPPGPKPLGMLVPVDKTPIEEDCWAVTIRSTEEGYVKDDDANKINYDDLLKKMQQAVHDANQERTSRGYRAMELVGWAEPPRYDAATHKFYWAKEFKVEGADEDTLNYDIRILGRHGFLVLSAIASIQQLPEIRKQAPQILAAVNFNEGSRYTDFDPKIDKVATYGLAALVAGGIAAKLGFFKLLLVALVAAKKFIIIAFAAAAAWFRKLFKKRDNTVHPVNTLPPPDSGNPPEPPVTTI